MTKSLWVLTCLGVALTVGVAPGRAQADEAPSVRVLDAFENVTPWKAVASDGVTAAVSAAPGPGGQALRLDFDLAGTGGYALARRALALDLPARYELSFDLRADAPDNHFQVKLIDASGDNVWWVNRPNFTFPRSWQRITIKPRHIEFAWGPTNDRTLRHAASIEFAVAAGRGGGRGTIYVKNLVLRVLPPEIAAQAPAVYASSWLPGAEPSHALDGAQATAWKSDPAAGPTQTLTVDFHRPVEFGGLTVRWLPRAHATRYDIQFSDDGTQWRTVRRVVGARGGPDAVWLPESETRFLRLALSDGPARAYALAELQIRDLAFGASLNGFFETLARDSPRGTYPRGMSGEQTTWTLVGIDGGAESGLLSEDGALEVARGQFSIEPFVVAKGQVASWADVEAAQSLAEGYLPMPRVTWRQVPWQLQVSAFATGSRGRSEIVARYELRNLSTRQLPLELVLAIRPFQVNPPSQFLSTLGGAASVRDIHWNGEALGVDGGTVLPLERPDRVAAFPFDAGPVTRLIGAADWAAGPTVHDEFGHASAALGYKLTLAPGATATIGVVIPLSGAPVSPDLRGEPAAAWIARQEAAVAAAWRQRLGRVSIDAPAAAEPLLSTLRTALAHILITRDGPVLRPGTRSYARSWIRDGAMMAESLLRLGHGDVAAEYLRWYAPRQFATGKVPCCIDERGADPVPEHDSAGQLIFLAAELYRYTKDTHLLEQMWPHVEAAVRYLDSLRHSERTDVNLAPARRALYGLLPASISHEGYSAKPMHSYWDDFWALKGYQGAIATATALGHDDAARRFEAARAEFRLDVETSLRHAAATHGIDYLPGCAELGDFDPTSSTIAIAPLGELHRLPAPLVSATFERYWREFVERRDGRRAWDDYTPYEIRTVSTFIRLGWRERAHAALAFFLHDRRPPAWNQWPEVIGRDPRQPRFIGDLPHGWVASDFIRAALDIFAYERERDQALVLGAGIPPDWLGAPGITVRDLRTPYGFLSYSVRNESDGVVWQLDATSPVPPGGLVLVWPGTQPPPEARINGKPAAWDGHELRVRELPARVVVKGTP